MDKTKSLSRRAFVGVSATLATVFYFWRKSAPTPAPQSASDSAPRDPAANRTPTDSVIVRAAIHPGIGIARVGNSSAEDDFFIGPEIPEPPPLGAGVSRDPHGAIKRQAARFRIYGLNAAGEVVKEITASDENKIQWQAHLANKKAQWYRFIAAMDLEEAKNHPTIRRNASVKGEARKKLMIDPGPRSIAGKSTRGIQYRFGGGKFETADVMLGELRTDEEGRLIVLGGIGDAGSPRRKSVYNPKDPDTFNNADGWYDDISDGPVRAKLTINGRDIPVDSAWVAVAPPNYAPDVVGWRTMYELLVDTYVTAGILPKPETTSFAKDVWPILKRLSALGWLNKGFADNFGAGTSLHFEDTSFAAALAQLPTDAIASKQVRAKRESVKDMYDSFRILGRNTNVKDRKLWPMLYGDSYGSYDGSIHDNFIVPSMQAMHLDRWVAGKFISDWSPASFAKPPQQLSDLPLAEQPHALDKAALHFCLADAFHPGCELTWPMRHASLYRAPFRIKERGAGEQEPDYGDSLSPADALGARGPLHAQGPGDLTKWMAVPWQGDTLFCRSGYEPDFDPYIPSFWPARVPNQVLTDRDYKVVMDQTLPREERLAAFKNRDSWVRHLSGTPPEQILQMVKRFAMMGIVETRPGIQGDPEFPEVMLVESLPAQMLEAQEARAKSREAPGGRAGSPPVLGSAAPSNVQKAGWQDREELDQWKKMRMRQR